MSVSISQAGQNPYLISVGKADYSRAASLNLIFDDFSLNFFPFDKIADGDKILFAGCGNGQLVVEIVKKLNALNVTIVAFDISLEQLNCARKYAEKEGVHHIQWLDRDVHDLNAFKGQFNVVHARFILNHLRDAKLVTKHLCETVAAGGIFIGEELSGCEVDVTPNSPAYVEAVQAWEEMIFVQHARQCSDIAFAARMPRLLEKMGMLVTKTLHPNPTATTAAQKNVLPASLACAPRIFSAIYLSAIPQLKNTLETMRDAHDCALIFKHFTQIEAKKPPHKKNWFCTIL